MLISDQLKYKMHSLTLFCILCYYGMSKLLIKRPQKLVDNYYQSNRDIPFSVANFGDIPWGHKLVGDLALASPLYACEAIQPDVNRTFVLIKRGGNCTFVTKVRNAQQAGYSLAIIEDDKVEITENYTMADDGSGYTVHIPSIFIGKGDGEILQNYTEGRMKQFGEVTPIQIVIQFDVAQQEKVDVILLISLKNRETFKLLRQFEPYYQSLVGSNIEYELLYQLYSMEEEFLNQEYQNCLGSGRYCALDPDASKIGTGRQVVEESLRQICLFKHFPNEWFKYMDAFDRECLLPQAWDGCSNKLVRTLLLDNSQIKECIEGSYYNATNNQTVAAQYLNTALTPNRLLDRQITLTKNSGFRGFPGALINGQAYKGRLDAKDIFSEICNGFKSAPLICQGEVENAVAVPGSNSNLLYTIMIIIGIMLVFFLIMFVVYTRMVTRDISSGSQQQVQEMVQQYIQFYDKKKSDAV